MKSEESFAVNNNYSSSAGRRPLSVRERWMIAAIVVLGLATVGCGGYIMYSAAAANDETRASEVATEDYETSENVKEVQEVEQGKLSTQAEMDDEIAYAGFSTDKVTNNPDGYTYAFFAEDSRVGLNSIGISDDGKSVHLGVSWYTLADVYHLAGHDDAQQYVVESYEIPFDQPVVGAYTGGYGQAFPGMYYLFFAMADGSVEYMPVYEAARDGKFASYGTVPGVTNMVDLIQAQAHDDMHGWATILARQADGSYVDMATAMAGLAK